MDLNWNLFKTKTRELTTSFDCIFDEISNLVEMLTDVWDGQIHYAEAKIFDRGVLVEVLVCIYHSKQLSLSSVDHVCDSKFCQVQFVFGWRSVSHKYIIRECWSVPSQETLQPNNFLAEMCILIFNNNLKEGAHLCYKKHKYWVT